MRKVLMTVAAAFVLLGTAISTKADQLLRSADVSIIQDENIDLVLKHATELFGDSDLSMTGHSSHSSHRSHNSHSSHMSHSSHYSSR